MHYSFDLTTMSIISITIAISSITSITVSILKHCPKPSPSRLSHVIQLRPYKSVHHFHHYRLHVCQIHYSLNPITISITCITITITSITCITASILYQCPSLQSPSPSRQSNALHLQSFNNVHHHRNHVYHMYYSFNPKTMSINTAITFLNCIKASMQ